MSDQQALTAGAETVRLPPSIEQRYNSGRALRETVPRADHAKWSPPDDRRDPIDILAATSRHRIPELLPIRYHRMAKSTFAFLRGAAAIMAEDLASTSTPGIQVQACGDCHLANFGSYQSPEGNAVFDINDFDETAPSPFEWDLKRLATSLVLAGREAGLSEKHCVVAATKCVAAYRKRVSRLVELPPFAAWRSRIDVAAALSTIGDTKVRHREERRLKEAQRKPDEGLFGVHRVNGKWQIQDKWPLVFHLGATREREARAAFTAYAANLDPDRRVLVERFSLTDVAFKVVGVGSVGTFCAVGLLMTADEQPLLLQIKEAVGSVLGTHPGGYAFKNHGQRVVVGQRLMQAASDVFLGWAPAGGDRRHFYVRHLKNAPLARISEDLEEDALQFYAVLCGKTLARAHARSGDSAQISGYLGKSDEFDTAIAEFAIRYAEQSKTDYEALLHAIRTGRLPAKEA
jgi:uncharacterized protein (DUF2252 family)